MSRPTPQQLDAFANGIAEGLSVRAAAFRAGYARKSKSFYRWPKREAFKARVEKFRLRRASAGANGLEPIHERLLAAADLALALNSAPSLRAACEILTVAMKLTQQLPPPDAIAPRDYEMTHEAWMATFAPKEPEPT